MLGGRIRIGSMFVPAAGTRGARIDELQIGGRDAHARPNTVLPVGDGSYAVFLQEAALPGKLGTDVGIVGVRVVAGDRQILLGLARKPAVQEVSRGASVAAVRPRAARNRRRAVARDVAAAPADAAASAPAPSRSPSSTSVCVTSGAARARSRASTARAS